MKIVVYDDAAGRPAIGVRLDDGVLSTGHADRDPALRKRTWVILTEATEGGRSISAAASAFANVLLRTHSTSTTVVPTTMTSSAGTK